MSKLTISAKNINDIINSLKKASKHEPKNKILMVNTNKIVLNRDKYKGVGRPRKTDYDCVPDEELIKSLKDLGFKL